MVISSKEEIAISSSKLITKKSSYRILCLKEINKKCLLIRTVNESVPLCSPQGEEEIEQLSVPSSKEEEEEEIRAQKESVSGCNFPRWSGSISPLCLFDRPCLAETL